MTAVMTMKKSFFILSHENHINCIPCVLATNNYVVSIEINGRENKLECISRVEARFDNPTI